VTLHGHATLPHLVTGPTQVQSTGPCQAKLVICEQAIDITYVRLPTSFDYLAGVLDVYARRCVGWKLSSQIDTQLTLDALQWPWRNDILRQGRFTTRIAASSTPVWPTSPVWSRQAHEAVC
jgi:transposase InsO family protein